MLQSSHKVCFIDFQLQLKMANNGKATQDTGIQISSVIDADNWLCSALLSILLLLGSIHQKDDWNYVPHLLFKDMY